MQHIEDAGVHSGDSACVLPRTDGDRQVEEMRRHTRSSPGAGVIGLINVQYAIKNGSCTCSR